MAREGEVEEITVLFNSAKEPNDATVSREHHRIDGMNRCVPCLPAPINHHTAPTTLGTNALGWWCLPRRLVESFMQHPKLFSLLASSTACRFRRHLLHGRAMSESFACGTRSPRARRLEVTPELGLSKCLVIVELNELFLVSSCARVLFHCSFANPVGAGYQLLGTP